MRVWHLCAAVGLVGLGSSLARLPYGREAIVALGLLGAASAQFAVIGLGLGRFGRATAGSRWRWPAHVAAAAVAAVLVPLAAIAAAGVARGLALLLAGVG